MQIRLQINEENLLRNLRLAFTSSSAVLAELMQNARRAGATFVRFERKPDRRLCVTDDGRGIADMQLLFSVAESRWTPEVMEAESPYGMGYLAAIFAAEELLILSNGQRVSCRTEDVVARKSIPVTRCKTPPGTYMELTGDWSESLSTTLKRLAKGFPIPVFLDGEPLARPHALGQGLAFHPFSAGQIHMPGRDHDRPAAGGHVLGTRCVALYLQGLPIATRTSGAATANIVHLDSTQFAARMPDRDCLIDQPTHEAAIREAIRDEWRRRLIEVKTAVSAHEFADGYFETLKFWQCMDLLDDVTVVPRALLFRVEGNPGLTPTDVTPWFIERYDGKPVTRKVLRSGLPLVQLDDLVDETSLPAWHYAYRARTLCVTTHALTSRHWLNAYVEGLGDSVEVRVVGDTADGHYTGEHVVVATRECDAIELDGPVGPVTIKDTCLYLCDESGIGRMLIPAEASDGDDIRQVSTFEDEFDIWHEDWDFDERRRFRCFLLSLRNGSEAAAVAALLTCHGLRAYPRLLNRSFVVGISETGEVTATAHQPPPPSP